MGLAKTHAMHSLDDCANTLERPQLGPKSVLGGTSQKSSTHAGQLLRIELGWAASLRHRAQCINAAFIEKTLPGVYGLPSRTYGKRNFGTSFARE